MKNQQTILTLVMLAIISVIFPSLAHAERVTSYPKNGHMYVPHFYEFASDNPNGYWWCGQAALKVVLQYEKPVQYPNADYSLQKIHNALTIYGKHYHQDNCGTSGKWCAYIEDLVDVAKKQYSINAVLHEIKKPDPRSGRSEQQVKQEIFSVLRNAAASKKLAIVFTKLNMSSNKNTAGHAWVFMGYNTDGVNNPNQNPDNVYLFFRDVYDSSVTSPEMDDWYTFSKFYESLKVSSNPNSQYYKVGVF